MKPKFISAETVKTTAALVIAAVTVGCGPRWGSLADTEDLPVKSIEVVLPLTIEQAVMLHAIHATTIDISVNGQAAARGATGELMIGSQALDLPYTPDESGPRSALRRQSHLGTAGFAFRTDVPMPGLPTRESHIIHAVITQENSPSVPLIEATGVWPAVTKDTDPLHSVNLSVTSLPSANNAGFPSLVQAFAREKAPALGLDPALPSGTLSDDEIEDITSQLKPHLENAASAISQAIQADQDVFAVKITVDAPSLATPSITHLECLAPSPWVCGAGRPIGSSFAIVNFGCHRLNGCAFECSNDDDSFSPCEAPLRWENLSPGHRSLSIRARDVHGSLGPPAILMLSVLDPSATDLVSGPFGPDLTGIGPLAQYTQTPPNGPAGTATFSYSCDAACIWSCAWDGLPFRACSSPFMLGSLKNGRHEFSVRATDATGHPSTVNTYTWVVGPLETVAGTADPTTAEPVVIAVPGAKPQTNIGSGPPALTQSTEAAISFSSSNPDATFECSLDGAPFIPCSPPFEVQGLKAGAHTLRVRAVGPSGEVEEQPVTFTWTVDNVEPRAPDSSKLNVAQNAPGTSDSIQGGVGAVDPGSLVKLWADAILSTLIASGLADADGAFPSLLLGDNLYAKIFVTATDPAGNQSAAATVFNDTLPPIGGVINYSDTYYRASKVPVTFIVGVDSGTGISQVLLRRSETPLTDGSCGPYAPFSTIVTRPSKSPFMDTTATGGRCFRYDLVVSDQAGHSATYTSPSSARVDTEPPSGIAVVRDGTGQDIDIQGTTIAFSASWPPASDAASGIDRYEHCLSTSGSPGTCEGPDTTWQIIGNTAAVTRTNLNLNEGTRYYVHVRARDRAGNYGPPSASDGFIVDITPPQFDGLGSATPVSENRIELTWVAAADDVSSPDSIVYQICRSRSVGGCSTFEATCVLPPGTTSFSDTGTGCGGTALTGGTGYFYRVRAMDESGNVDFNGVEKNATTWMPHAQAVFAHAGGHTCALGMKGSVKCWGRNNRGQLGNGSLTPALIPVEVPMLTGVSTLAMGELHTCALMRAGTVQCWGANADGQVGDGTSTDRPAPVTVTSLSNASAIAAGSRHTCAILPSGVVRCWGANASGQIGDGTDITKRIPTVVSSLTGAVSLTGGSDHTCAVAVDGTLRCWGRNLSGRLGDGTTITRHVPAPVALSTPVHMVAAGEDHTCALLSKGTTACWGSNENGQLGDGTTSDSTLPVHVTGLSNLVSLTAGARHTCALDARGMAHCWGSGNRGQLGDPSTLSRAAPVTVTSISNLVTIAAGENHTCALDSTGLVRCWGEGTYGQLGDGFTSDRSLPAPIDDLIGPITVSVRPPLHSVPYAAGAYGRALRESLAAHFMFHSCVLLSNGSAKCWGRNQFGQLGNGSVSMKIVPTDVAQAGNSISLSGGIYHTCALVSDGRVKCWGANFSGQLGDGSASNRFTPVAVSTLTQAVSVQGGLNHTCAIVADGTARCWGRNFVGQLGDGTTVDSAAPVNVSQVSGVVAMAAGSAHTCAVTADGTALCWGLNDNHQLGDGTTFTRLAPVGVSTLTNAISIAAGLYHTCALTAEGTARCWGRGASGQLGGESGGADYSPVAVSSLSDALSISCGDAHTCAVTSDGTVRCWGSNVYGQIGDGTSLDRFTPVSVASLSGAVTVGAGADHTCALTADGSVWCWGSNLYGQLGDGLTSDSHVPSRVRDLGQP